MSFHPGSMSNGQQTSSDTHVPKTAAEIAAEQAGMIAPSDVRGGRASCEVRSARETALESAALDFIGKVDRGEARSSKSYAAFKAALTQEGTSRGGVDLQAAVDLLESNARVQAKLLADTGRHDEKATALLQLGTWYMTPAALLDWQKKVEEFLAASPVPSAESK